MRSARRTSLLPGNGSDEDVSSATQDGKRGTHFRTIGFAISAFRRQLKTFLLRGISVLTASEVFFLNYNAL